MTEDPSVPAARRPGVPAAFILTLAGGVVFIVLVILHFGPVNGPSYFRWPWLERPNSLASMLLLLAAASPALVAQFVKRRGVAVLLVVITPALMQWTAAERWPDPLHGMDRAESLVVHEITTSYFFAAEKLESDWLRDFPNVLQHSPMHAATKPPGPILFFRLLIDAFGKTRAPFVAAIVMLTFASLSVAATYFAFRTFGDDAAFAAATIVALVPSVAALYPVVDWLYPVFSVAAIATWHIALTRDSWRAVIAFAAIVFVMSFWTYSLLVLGAPCLAMLIAHRKNALAYVGAVAAIVIGAYALLWLATGFDPIATFRMALRRQREIIAMMDVFWIPLGIARTYPRTILGDLQEFAFGMSWAPCILAIIWAATRTKSATPMACLATPFIIALSGLLRAETSRVWIFVMPLVALPAAMELSAWPRWQRFTVALLIACGAVAVYANAAFLLV